MSGPATLRPVSPRPVSAPKAQPEAVPTLASFDPAAQTVLRALIAAAAMARAAQAPASRPI